MQKRATILILDEEKAFLKKTERNLRRQGYNILVSTEIREAQDILEQESVDLLALSIDSENSPMLSWVESLRKSWKHFDLPLLALLPSMDEELAGKAIQSKCDDVFAKTNPESLLGLRIQRILFFRKRSPLTNARKERTILLVDSDFNASRRVERFLREKEFQVTAVDSAQEAVKLIQTHPPDLLIVDWLMPDMDGLALIKTIRQSEHFQHIPTLLISAQEHLLFVDKAIAEGADDFIHKDANLLMYIKKIETLLRVHEQEDRSSQRSIMDKLKLEALVQERTFELQRTNEELSKELEKYKKIEKSLKKEKNHAEASTHAKSEFLANMSHEIRSPLNAIVGFSQILMRDASELSLPKMFLQYLENIQISGDKLIELINNILDLSKIEAGKMVLEEEDVNLEVLVQGIFHINKVKALQKKLTFHYDIDPNLPKMIRSDRTKLNQILMNLLSNAIKFTEEGKAVKLRVYEEQNWIWLQVEDQGIGIPKERQAHIFNSFEQADQSIVRFFGGTGLGLSIVKTMAELLGGHIAVESEVGKGSTFSVQLPLKHSSAEPKVNTVVNWSNLQFPKEYQIVAVEDNPIGQQMIEALFHRLGLAVTLVDNGDDAIEKVLELQPDLVIMDINLPGTNGIDATQALRDQGLETPIIALSAEAFVDTQKAAYQAGVDEYLLKPLDFKKLVPLLVRHLTERPKVEIRKPNPKWPLSAEQKAVILAAIRELKKIPPFSASKIQEKVNHIIELSEHYDAPYFTLAQQILEASLSRNSKKIPELIKEALKLKVKTSK